MSNNQNFQNQANTSQYDFGNVKPSQAVGGVPQSRAGGRPLNTAMKGPEGGNRPMTSIKAVFNATSKGEGFSKQGKVDLSKIKETGPQEQFKVLEKEINTLIEESANLQVSGQLNDALEKAKDAYNKQKTLRRQREQANMLDSINVELGYCVSFNYANMLHANGILQESLSKYNEIIKSKQYPQAGRLRVNMGNIYFTQEKFSIAIKMYRMALDLIPATSQEMRFKILQNIGHAFVKLGQFQESINSYQTIMKGSPDFQTAFNLMLCLYALGDKIRMKDCFASMLSIEIPGFTEEQDEEMNKGHGSGAGLDGLVVYSDILREEIKEKKREAVKLIVDAAQLIAPVIQEDIVQGYQWILQTLKNSVFPEVQSEIEICRAMAYLKKKNIEQSIETLKSFERKDKTMMARIATNISFLFFLENDYPNAEKYAEMAIGYDRYNAQALVNRGNCLFVRNDFLRAKQQYLEAIGVEADCIEALYNLAFVNKKLNMFNEALQALEKLQTIVMIPEVIYQMASIHELTGNIKHALKWYQVLLTQTPTDASILARVGNIFNRDDDDSQALHYYAQSYKYMPTNIETISWLGIYYVKQELYERACHFFERAAQIQTKEIKWRLMVASCYRRMGSYQKALKIYEEIYQEAPDNIECLKFLTQLCKDMGQPYEEYAAQLRRLERAQESMPDYNNADLQMINNEQDRGDDDQDDTQVNLDKMQSRRQQAQPKKKAAPQNEDQDLANADYDDLLM